MLTSGGVQRGDLFKPDSDLNNPVSLTRERTIGEMLLYPEDTAAGLMTLETAALSEAETVTDGLAILRDPRRRPADVSAIYVEDQAGKLVGSLSIQELMYAPPSTKLREVMVQKPISVDINGSFETVARLIDDHELNSLPVVDSEGRLQGAIAVDDLSRIAEKRAANQVFKLFGLGGEDRALGPFWNSVRSRFPWLLINLITVLIAGLVISSFESTIDRLALLAVFIPVIIGQAGIAGTQTLTLVVRSLALNEVTESDSRKLLFKEGMLALTHGSVISFLLGLIVWAWRSDLYLGLVVGSAMLLNLMMAGLGGVAVPLVMKAIRIDPAASSGVVVTTATETLGILAYLGLATVFLSLLRTS